MRAIRWTTEAVDEFVASIEQIQKDSPAAAQNVAQAVTDSIERLIVFPGIGRQTPVGGTRELVCPPLTIYTRSTTPLSGPLQALVDDGTIILKTIPGT